jgi:hypothetical protein
MKHGWACLAAVLCILPASSALADITLYINTADKTFSFDGSTTTVASLGDIGWESSSMVQSIDAAEITNLKTPDFQLFSAEFNAEHGFLSIYIATNSHSENVTVNGTGDWQSYAWWNGASCLEDMIGSQFTSGNGAASISVVQYSAVPEPAACAGFAGIAGLGAAFVARRIRRKKQD